LGHSLQRRLDATETNLVHPERAGEISDVVARQQKSWTRADRTSGSWKISATESDFA
jgi:hypothetical protein